MKRCYYETLECQKGATADVLKSAYRKLAMRFHPDKNPGDHTAEIKFKEISEAYEVLKDDQKRAAYDRFGHAAFEGGMGAAGARAGFGDFSSFGDVFEDIFGQMMGGMGRGKRQNRGQDLRYNLTITLEEAFRGRSAEIKVPTQVACEPCSGSGAEPGHSPETCPSCAGHGKVRATQGFFTIERTCSSCRGSGKIIRNPCKTCRGSGLVQKDRMLNVDVPPGVEEGTRIRLSGEGAAGVNGGPAGDLYIFLSVAEHPIFQRDGHDLHCRAPVSFVTAGHGRQHRGAHPGWRPRQSGHSRRGPAGAAIPPAGQGDAGAAQRPARRPLCRIGG
jgi:molecular chaperone DnaJ